MKKALIIFTILSIIGFSITVGGIFIQNIYTEGNINKYNNQFENIVYNKIHNALEDGDKNVILLPEAFFLGSDRIVEITESTFTSIPDLIYFKGARYRAGKLEFEYVVNENDLKTKRAELNAKAESIALEIKLKYDDVYNRVKAVHDYLLLNITYDDDLRETDNLALFSESHDAYGALVEGIAVCDGYAKSMKLILDKIGINNIIVYGFAGGESHSWNIVELDDEFYHIDATWDDLDSPTDVNHNIYTYLNVDDDYMSITHSWDIYAYPECNGKKYNYFSIEGYFAKSEDELKNIIIKGITNGQNEMPIRLTAFTHSEDSVSESIESAIKNSNISISQYSYIYDENREYLLVSFRR